MSLPPAPARRSTAASRVLDERLGAVLPGGNTRTATWYAPYPVALAEGRGCRVVDADGNEYLDFVNNYTSLVHGHAHPAVVEAIAGAAAGGTVFPAPLALQAELAERIVERVPSIELLRFVNSGSEANMQAVRCARAATGRSLLVKARGGYHGSWEQLPPTDEPAPGIPGSVLDLVEMVPYNDEAALRDVMERRGKEVAAIVLEPVLGACIVPGSRTFLECSRRLADAYGALLIWDEVVTLRLARGGMQELLGIRPDLTTLGKIIGGGLPVGAFGGAHALMERFDPRHPDALPHHGTFNGNACTMAAGVATLDLLDDAEIARIDALGTRLSDGLRGLLAAHDLCGCVTQAGSLVQLHLDVARPPTRYEDTRPGSPQLRAAHRAALAAGVYIAPRGELCISTAMDEQVVDLALERLHAALLTSEFADRVD